MCCLQMESLYFVKKTADALEKKYGGGFLDTINEAENDAPRVIRELAARTA